MTSSSKSKQLIQNHASKTNVSISTLLSSDCFTEKTLLTGRESLTLCESKIHVPTDIRAINVHSKLRITVSHSANTIDC